MRADAGSVGSVIINLHRRSADPPRMINLLDNDRDEELSKLLPKFGVEAPSAVAAPAPRGRSDAGVVALPEGPSPTQPCQSPLMNPKVSWGLGPLMVKMKLMHVIRFLYLRVGLCLIVLPNYVLFRPPAALLFRIPILALIFAMLLK